MSAESSATANTAATAAAPSKGLHIGLWVAQVLLGAAFLMAGLGKSTQPIEELAKNMAWVPAIPGGLVRFIGVSELLGGLGLILPAATRVAPVLTPVAGLGLATVMSLAAVFHLTRGEYGGIVINLVMGGIAAFIAWGRFKKAPIAGR